MTQIKDRWTQQQNDDAYAEYLLGPKPKCQVCGSRDVRTDDDRDWAGEVISEWLECNRCGEKWTLRSEIPRTELETRLDKPPPMGAK